MHAKRKAAQNRRTPRRWRDCPTAVWNAASFWSAPGLRRFFPATDLILIEPLGWLPAYRSHSSGAESPHKKFRDRLGWEEGSHSVSSWFCKSMTIAWSDFGRVKMFDGNMEDIRPQDISYEY
jgi:hypothetical protein